MYLSAQYETLREKITIAEHQLLRNEFFGSIQSHCPKRALSVPHFE